MVAHVKELEYDKLVKARSAEIARKKNQSSKSHVPELSTKPNISANITQTNGNRGSDRRR